MAGSPVTRLLLERLAAFGIPLSFASSDSCLWPCFIPVASRPIFHPWSQAAQYVCPKPVKLLSTDWTALLKCPFAHLPQRLQAVTLGIFSRFSLSMQSHYPSTDLWTPLTHLMQQFFFSSFAQYLLFFTTLFLLQAKSSYQSCHLVLTKLLHFYSVINLGLLYPKIII